MQNTYLKRDYRTYIIDIVPSTSIGEVWIPLNDSTESVQGFIIVEPGTPNEESIFYHRRVGNTVYCYGVNRSNPVEHLINAPVLMANSIDYMNRIIAQIHDQGYIYKKSTSHIIITWGSFYVGGENIMIADVDTSASLPGKSLAVNTTNYIYLKDGDYFITPTADSSLILIWTVLVALDGTITDIEKFNTVSFAETGPRGLKWDKGIIWRWVYSWATAYIVDDVVHYNGSSYICILASTGNVPTNTTYWGIVAEKGADWEWIGDMLTGVYDPNEKNADAFSMDNMDETATKKILSESERTLIGTISGKESSTNKWIAGWYASLDWSGKVPAAQLPSYVDDVLEYADLASFPVTGTTGILYIAIDTGYQYRWTGSVYAEIKGSGETHISAWGLINSALDKSTPVDADMIGLMDSAAGNILKKLSWSNIKATLKTYFDWLYVDLTNPQSISGPKTFTAAWNLLVSSVWDTNIVIEKNEDTTWYSKTRLFFKRTRWTFLTPLATQVWDVIWALGFSGHTWSAYKNLASIEVRDNWATWNMLITDCDLYNNGFKLLDVADFYRYSIVRSVGNLVVNNSFETDISWYTVYGSATNTRDTTEFYNGVASLKSVCTWVSNGAIYVPWLTTAGKRYTVSCYVKWTVGRNFNLYVANATNDQVNHTLTSSWTRVQLSFISNTTNWIYFRTQDALGATFYVDAVQIEEWTTTAWTFTASQWRITVAIKNYEGNDPTSTKPVKYQEVNWTIRTITTAKSFTMNAWINWLNLGSAELATKETDLFLYAINGSAGENINLWVSRLSTKRNISEVPWGWNNEKYIEQGWNSWTENCTLLGRFNAILSGGWAYTWSIPTTSVIENRPIYETRELSWIPIYTGFSVNPGNTHTYKLIGNSCFTIGRENTNWTSNATTFTKTLPFNALDLWSWTFYSVYDVGTDNWTDLLARWVINSGWNTMSFTTGIAWAWTASGWKRFKWFSIIYEI